MGGAFVLLGGRGRVALGLIHEEAAAFPTVGMGFPSSLDRLEQIRVALNNGASVGLVPVFLVTFKPRMWVNSERMRGERDRDGRREGATNLHMEEFLGDDASLVVQGVEFAPMSPIVIMEWPVLQGNEETEPRLPHRPVPHDVSP